MRVMINITKKFENKSKPNYIRINRASCCIKKILIHSIKLEKTIADKSYHSEMSYLLL